MIIAVDGPAGSGKSTVSKMIADELGITYLDTGAMYRLFAYKLMKENIDFSDREKELKLLEDLNIDMKDNRFYSGFNNQVNVMIFQEGFTLKNNFITLDRNYFTGIFIHKIFNP